MEAKFYMFNLTMSSKCHPRGRRQWAHVHLVLYQSLRINGSCNAFELEIEVVLGKMQEGSANKKGLHHTFEVLSLS